jgi:hypothetical protein
MAYGFGVNYGTGFDTDGIRTNYSGAVPTRFSMGGWIINSGIDDSGIGRNNKILTQDDGTNEYFDWLLQHDINQYLVQVPYPSSTFGFRHWTYTADVWQHNLVTWDLNDTTNGPFIYQNGIDLGRPGDFTAGVGSPVTNNTIAMTIGGRYNTSNVLARSIDARLADMAFWNEILSPGEVMGLYIGSLRPYQVRPNNLLGYWPLDGYQQHPGLNLAPNSNTLNMALLKRNGLLLKPSPPHISASPIRKMAGPLFQPSIFQPAIYLAGPTSTGAADLPTMLNVGADFRRRVATIGY